MSSLCLATLRTSTHASGVSGIRGAGEDCLSPQSGYPARRGLKP